MRSKFELTYENYTGRFTKGGFLPGDFVKFKKDALSNSEIAASDDLKAKVKELMDSDLHLRISRLTHTSGAESSDPDGTPSQYNVSIYATGPGNSAASTDSVVTVPLVTVDRVARADQEAQMKVPDSFKRAADKRVNHTNQKKATADLEDDSYNKGKDFKGGKRDNSVNEPGPDDEFEEDSDVGKKVKKESVDINVQNNLKFYVHDNRSGEWVHERNVSGRENVDVERMFKKWLKLYSGGELRVVGTDTTNSGGDYYARIADSREGVRVMDSNSFFVDTVEDTTPKA